MITALLVSVNYSDYLEVALRYNTKQFDNIIVLTIESDKACQDVCSKYSNVRCLVFPDKILKRKRKQFNKGAILNAGLRFLNRRNYSDWLVLTDSDIVFPENFKELITSKEKNPKVLYTMNRNHCPTLARFTNYIKTKTHNFPKNEHEIPFVGFCQIFIYEVNKFSFSEDFDAENSDIIFLGHFCEKIKSYVNYMENTGKKMNTKDIKSILADEHSTFNILSKTDFVIHLGTPRKNWKGRITEKFI